MEINTNNQVKRKPGNPTGKRGFGDHPEHRNRGRWNYKTSFSYWLNKFKSLPVREFVNWRKEHQDDMTVAEDLAYTRVERARKGELKEFELLANRTEGKPVERKEITGEEGGPLIIKWDDDKDSDSI